MFLLWSTWEPAATRGQVCTCSDLPSTSPTKTGHSSFLVEASEGKRNQGLAETFPLTFRVKLILKFPIKWPNIRTEKEREGLLLWSEAEGLKPDWPSESLGVLKNYIDKHWALRRIRFRCFRMEPGSLYFRKSGQEVLMISQTLNYWLKPWELCLPKAISQARYTFFSVVRK